jgi:hypothetical protein
VKEGLPPKGPQKVVPQAFPKGEEEEGENAVEEEAKEPAGASR